VTLITRKEAIQLISSSSKREHLLLVAALMKQLARRLGEDENEWQLVGLLHDLDYDQTVRDRSKHGMLAASQLEGRLPERCLHAIRSHDFRTGVRPESRLDLALISSDALINFLSRRGHQRLASDQAMKEIETESIERPWIKDDILGCRKFGIEPAEYIRLAQNLKRQ